jgi:Putative esterase
MKKIIFLSFLFGTISGWCQTKFKVSFPLQEGPLNGRLLIILSKDNKKEPRFQVSDGSTTQLLFGLDLENWQKGKVKEVGGEDVFGFPIQNFANVPAGDYYLQVLLHKYEIFKRKDGHTLKLPMDRGEGQQWNLAPGNMYSKPVKVTISHKAPKTIAVTMNQVIPPLAEPEDTKYVKHVKIQSKMLTEFWGRPMFLGAHVLLPEGFDERQNVRYPLAIFHGHFPANFSGFRTTPPDTILANEYNSRFKIFGYNKIIQQEAYNFYKQWTGPNFPRVLAIEIQHPCPFYDDSYAVNSENVGPYGDAIMQELIPYIEKQFRGIGEGWARFTYGGSTGGWEALAVQVKYPDEFNGCYAACPDPIDFRAFTTVNLYEDKNAYFYSSPFKKTHRPGRRDHLGQLSATLLETNMFELALGTKSRSGQQYDIWEAVYSPKGKDGYPMPIWNKKTGEIDKHVADYWRENYDLSYILNRDWKKNGEKWKGKIHIYCGDMDNYYLNNAVYLAENMLKSLSQPAYDGSVDYGDRAEHCWNGDHTEPNYISRLRYHSMFIPKWTEDMQKTAPHGVDLKSWRY